MRMLSKKILLSCLLSGLLCFSVACKKKPAPPPVLTRGAELYQKTCAVCHGANGEGYKADQAPRLAQPEFLSSVSDEYLREAIRNGRAGTTMSAWSVSRGGPLTPADVEELIKFLHGLSKAPRAQLNESPLTGDASHGESVYARECYACHGVRGVGGPNVHIGNPQLVRSATNGFLRYAIKKGHPGTAMPSFDAKLGDPGIDDLVTLLRSWVAPAAPIPEPPKAAPIPLGPVPLNPKGPDPVGFKIHPENTPIDVVHTQLAHGARMVLLDARAPSDYTNEHIAGAVSTPFYDPNPYFDKLPKNTWLVAYCACPHAESGTLAAKLLAAGFKKVTVLDEGLGAWRMKKYGTHTGEKP